MALPLVRVDRSRVVDSRRRPIASDRIATPGDAVDVVGRGLAVGFGAGVLLLGADGAGPLTVTGVLALGAALLSWDR